VASEVYFVGEVRLATSEVHFVSEFVLRTVKFFPLKKWRKDLTGGRFFRRHVGVARFFTALRSVLNDGELGVCEIATPANRLALTVSGVKN
jgi:hypothetical protein